MTRAWVVPTLARLFGRQEQANTLYFVANALVFPGAMAYWGTRIFPPGSASVTVWLTGAIALGAGLGAFAQMGFAVMIDRHMGRARLLALSDVRPGAYLAARLGVTVAWSAIFAAVGITLLVAHGHVRVTPGLVATVASGAVANALVHGALGALVGGRATGLAVGAATIGAVGPLSGLISPVFYPSAALPVAGSLLHMMPLALTAAIFRAAIDQQAFPWTDMAALWALALAAVAAATRFMRWPQ